MIKRLVLVVGVVATLLFLAAPANADGYPPSDSGAPPAAVSQKPSTAAPSQSPSGALPRTGDDSSLTMARLAVVLVAGGGLLVLAARRRRATLA